MSICMTIACRPPKCSKECPFACLYKSYCSQHIRDVGLKSLDCMHEASKKREKMKVKSKKIYITEQEVKMKWKTEKKKHEEKKKLFKRKSWREVTASHTQDKHLRVCVCRLSADGSDCPWSPTMVQDNKRSSWVIMTCPRISSVPFDPTLWASSQPMRSRNPASVDLVWMWMYIYIPSHKVGVHHFL